jgi:hypothetical protein
MTKQHRNVVQTFYFYRPNFVVSFHIESILDFVFCVQI